MVVVSLAVMCQCGFWIRDPPHVGMRSSAQNTSRFKNHLLNLRQESFDHLVQKTGTEGFALLDPPGSRLRDAKREQGSRESKGQERPEQPTVGFPYCAWTESISHHLKSWLNPLFVGIYRGNRHSRGSEVVQDFVHPQYAGNQSLGM